MEYTITQKYKFSISLNLIIKYLNRSISRFSKIINILGLRSVDMKTVSLRSKMIRLLSSVFLFVTLFALAGFFSPQEVMADPPPPPATPSNFTATLHDPHQIDLSWTSVAGVTGYHIEESTHADFNPSIQITVLGAASVTYPDTIVYPGATFYYRIKSYNNGGDSTASAVQSVNIVLSPVTPPTAPTGLAGSFVNANQVNLTWTDTAANEVGFLLLRASDSNFTTGLASFDLPVNTTAYSDTGVSATNAYYYKILAFDAVGASAYSNIPLVSTIPVVNPGTDAAINQGDTFNRTTGSFTDSDNTGIWAATVNYGDTATTSVLTLNVNKTFTLNHTYNTAGSFTITVRVTDAYGATGSGTLRVAVASPYVPPPAPVIPPPAPVTLNGFSGNSNNLQVDYTGTVQQAVTLTTSDQGAKIAIPQGGHMLTSSGSPLTTLTSTAIVPASLPQPPPNDIVASGYEFGPNGATFNPPITITLKYNPADFPNVDLNSLKIGFWDGTSWLLFSASIINPATNEISVPVSHFTKYAVIGVKNIPTPVATPTVTQIPSVTPVITPAPTTSAAPTMAATTPPITTTATTTTAAVATTKPAPAP